jgi:Na+/melibiose symporter-like transporter
MELSIVGALLAGLLGTAVMSTMMKLSARAGMTDMPPMELVTGSMMTGDPSRAKQLGTIIHWIVMGTVVFGLGYAALFTALGSAGWLTGAAIGLVHGAGVGLVFMPMMPAMHPRMTRDPSTSDRAALAGGRVQLAAPGSFGSNWGSMTPVGLLLGHVVYGLVVALVYQAFV